MYLCACVLYCITHLFLLQSIGAVQGSSSSSQSSGPDSHVSFLTAWLHAQYKEKGCVAHTCMLLCKYKLWEKLVYSF